MCNDSKHSYFGLLGHTMPISPTIKSNFVVRSVMGTRINLSSDFCNISLAKIDHFKLADLFLFWSQNTVSDLGRYCTQVFPSLL
jgi:hypothetical protein